jgi:hypothetical protein
MEKAKVLCTSLLPPNVVAEHKSESGRRLDILGYVLDLNKFRLAIARKNVLKAVYGYVSVDLSAKVTVKFMQKLASWGSRYGEVCVIMRPLVRALYNSYRGKADHTSFHFTKDQCRVVVRVFRVFILMTAIDEDNFARTLNDFRLIKHEYVAEFDASLSGIGVIWYQVNGDGNEVPLGGCAVDCSRVHLNDGSQERPGGEGHAHGHRHAPGGNNGKGPCYYA